MDNNPQPNPEMTPDPAQPEPTQQFDNTIPDVPEAVQVQPEQSAPRPMPTPPPELITRKKPSLKPLLITIAAILVVLIGAGSVLGYTLWYQNPQKVITDAISHALQAESLSYTGEITALPGADSDTSSLKSMKITIDGKNKTNTGQLKVDLSFVDSEDKTRALSGEGRFDKDGNLFVKLDKISELLDEYAAEVGAEMPESINNLITKVDGNWIKISADDMKTISEDYSEQQTCITDAYKKLESDEVASREVADLYRENQFIIVKEDLGIKDGSQGYVIENDEAKTKAFVSGLKDTKIFTELKKCDDSLEIDADDFTGKDSEDDTVYRVEVWVTQFGHEFSEVKMVASDDEISLNAWIKPVFNSDVTIEAPTEFITLTELQSDIEEILGDLFAAPQMPSDDTLESTQPIRNEDQLQFQMQ